MNQAEKETYLREYSQLKNEGEPFFPYSVTHDGGTLTVQTWFDAATLHPVKAETYADDFCVIQCYFESVNLQS